MTTPQNQYGAEEAVLNLAKMLGVNIEIKDNQGGQEKPEKKKAKRKGRKLPKALKPGEAEKMLACLNTRYPTSLRDKCIFLLMYKLGLRISEPLNLRVEDVDLENAFVSIQQSKNNRDRTIPIDEETLEWMKKWKAIRPESEYFFSTLKGGKIDKRQIREKCYRLSKKAGVYIRDGKELKLVHPHNFRHTCFTELCEEGADIRSIQEIAGHANIATTSIYLSVRPQRLKKIIQDRGKEKNK